MEFPSLIKDVKIIIIIRTYYIHNVCMLLQLARIDDYALIFYKTARLDFRVKLKGNR